MSYQEVIHRWCSRFVCLSRWMSKYHPLRCPFYLSLHLSSSFPHSTLTFALHFSPHLSLPLPLFYICSLSGLPSLGVSALVSGLGVSSKTHTTPRLAAQALWPSHLICPLRSSHPLVSPPLWAWAAAEGSVVLRVGAVFRQTCFFCRAFVPFCVIVLTEWTPHLPGSCAPGLGLTLSHVSGCNLMAVFILCRLSLKALRKSLAFLSSALAARAEVLAVVIVRKNNICIRIHSKHVFFHISVREGRKGTEAELSLSFFLSLSHSLFLESVGISGPWLWWQGRVYSINPYYASTIP